MHKNERCLCDLRKHSKWSSDWPIAKLVGTATYAQLLDAAPGMFEPFPDWRSDGNTASSILSISDTKGPVFTQMLNHKCLERIYEIVPLITKEDKVPYPPNLVSTVLVEGELSTAELKRLLIQAAAGDCVDPRIEPLVGSSMEYSNPELTLGEILGSFVIYTLLVSLVLVTGIWILSSMPKTFTSITPRPMNSSRLRPRQPYF
jgi:hypothetical protein